MISSLPAVGGKGAWIAIVTLNSLTIMHGARLELQHIFQSKLKVR
jgi:hypothetical protein